MEFKFDLFMDVLWLGTICGIISTLFVQKIKEMKLISNSIIINIISIFVSIITGFVISTLFTSSSIIINIFVGIVTWLGAENIYSMLKEKDLMKTTREIFAEEDE